MKAGIHPEYKQQTVNCVCGASWETASTIEFKKLDICSSCHPFYTGKQKIIDSEGRIEKFKKKYAKASYGSKKK